MTKEELQSVMRADRRRQSVRALWIVGGIVAFFVGLLVLNAITYPV
jgi:hypothetical protein